MDGTMSLTQVLGHVRHHYGERLPGRGIEPSPDDRRLLHFLRKIEEKEVVLTGIGAVVYRPLVGLLTGRRIGEHGTGKLAFPGGHLKEGENWFDAAKREVKEEAGLDVEPVVWDHDQVAFQVTNNLYGERHYCTIWIACLSLAGDPANNEPERCDGWRFRTLDELAAEVDENEPAETAWIPLRRLRRYRERLGL